MLHNGVLQQVDSPLGLYDNPANLFVAGFIGSPAMNLLEAELTDSGAALFGHVVEVALPPEVRRAAPRSVTIGIRPESLRVTSEGQGIPVSVAAVEDLGADAYVYGVAGHSATSDDAITSGADIVIRSESRAPIRRGETVYVTAAPGDIRVFATDSGARLDRTTAR